MLDEYINNKIRAVFNEPFLGNSLVFSEEELSRIYDEAGDILRRVGAAYHEELYRLKDMRIVVFSIVQLTKEWKSDENAWLDFISKKLLGSQGDLSGKIYRQICKCIDTLNEYNELFVLKSFKKKYYVSMCSHAFAPKSSVKSFFDMCWDIYCEDLAQQYTPSDPILELIVSSLKNKFSSETSDDDIAFGSKIYGLRAGIKGLAVEKKELLIGLLDTAMTSIDSLFNNEPISYDTYFKCLLREWWSEKESVFGIKKERRHTKREFIATDYSKIKAKYILESGEAKLLIPSFRLQDHYEEIPYAVIVVNGEIYIKEPVPTMGSGIILKTKEMSFILNSLPISSDIDIQVLIEHNSEIIYDSKDSLKRDYIIFRSDSEVGSQSLLPGVYFMYTTKINDIIHPSDIKRKSSNLFSFVAHEGDVIRFADNILFFETEKTKKEIYFVCDEKKGILYREEDTIYKIIDGKLLVYLSNNCDLNDIGIRCSGSVSKLSDFKFSENNNYKIFDISNLIKEGKPTSAVIFRFSDNYIYAVSSVIRFDDISFTYDKSIYFGDESDGVISFKCDQYSIDEHFSIFDSECSFPLCDGDILFDPPILKWRFDSNEWNLKRIAPIYYKSITNSSMLELDLPLDYDCVVHLTNGVRLEKCGDKRQYKIGQTIHSLADSGLEDVTICIDVNEKTYSIARVFIKPGFSANPIYVKSDEFKIKWNPKTYIGETDNTLKLQLIGKNEIPVFEHLLRMDEEEMIECHDIEEDRYKLRIISMSRGFLAEETTIYEQTYLFGDERSVRFKGKVLKLKKVMLFNQLTPWKIGYNYGISNIKYLGNIDGSDFYSGRLFLEDVYGNIKYIDQMMKTKTGEKIKINPVRIELKTLSSCYIGYGLDLDDPDFEYDDEFSYGKNKGLSTIANENGGIDFYIFDICDD